MLRFGAGLTYKTVSNHGAGTASISGTPVVGQVVTATYNANDPDGAASGITYQWFRDSATSIGGATASTYTLVAADADHTVKCRVNYTDAAGNAESIFTPDSSSITGVLVAAFVAQTGTTGSSATPTFTGVSVGTADATRKTVVCVHGYGSNRAVNAVSLTGTAMTKVCDAGVDGVSQPCAIFIVNNPTGTTADISITFSGVISGGCAISTWSITGNPTITLNDTDTKVATDPMSLSLDCLTNGCLIAVGNREGSGAVTVSTMTQDYNVATTPTQRRAGGHTNTAANSTVTPGFDWVSALSCSGAGASWRSGS